MQSAVLIGEKFEGSLSKPRCHGANHQLSFHEIIECMALWGSEIGAAHWMGNLSTRSTKVSSFTGRKDSRLISCPVQPAFCNKPVGYWVARSFLHRLLGGARPRIYVVRSVHDLKVRKLTIVQFFSSKTSSEKPSCFHGNKLEQQLEQIG